MEIDAKYGRTVHLVMKDNLRLFNDPSRSSREWKLEYNARTSAECSNKREKSDFKLENGRHRSTKMWYCRLYHILMLHLPEFLYSKRTFVRGDFIKRKSASGRWEFAASLKSVFTRGIFLNEYLFTGKCLE